ncbi:alpha/beta hydrolase, partial [Streptomyces sp. NPDC046887]|uniref:alpha/beta fold hydrolase n=1 Tax=Streptomyces sp. NPDC046887 TaxID=3155472 RepID=UPI0033CDC459
AFRVTACDLPGHGALAGQRFTLEEAVERVGAALAEAERPTGRPAVLAGMSLGGYVALAAAVRHPELTAGLLLNNCTAQPRGGAARWYGRAGRLVRRAGEEWPARLNAALFRAMLPAESSAAVLSGGFSMAGFADAVEELPRHDFLALAGRCSVPLLIANSRADRLFRSDEYRFLAAAREAGSPASLVHIGGSHLAALTDPETFTRVLRAGCERLTGTGAYC